MERKWSANGAQLYINHNTIQSATPKMELKWSSVPDCEPNRNIAKNFSGVQMERCSGKLSERKQSATSNCLLVNGAELQIVDQNAIQSATPKPS